MGKIYNIKNNREFKRIYQKGRYAVSNLIVVYMLPNSLCMNRIGITASKKFGKSVKRNRIRRIIRECYRVLQDELIKGFDFVIVARKAENNEPPGFHQIYKEMRFLMKRLRVMEQGKK